MEEMTKERFVAVNRPCVKDSCLMSVATKRKHNELQKVHANLIIMQLNVIWKIAKENHAIFFFLQLNTLITI